MPFAVIGNDAPHAVVWGAGVTIEEARGDAQKWDRGVQGGSGIIDCDNGSCRSMPSDDDIIVYEGYSRWSAFDPATPMGRTLAATVSVEAGPHSEVMKALEAFAATLPEAMGERGWGELERLATCSRA